MRRCIVWSAALGCALLWGCSSSAKKIEWPRTALKVEVVPQKPFEWVLDLSGVSDRENLARQIEERAQENGHVRQNVSLTADTIRITGGHAYQAIRPLLAKRGLMQANSYSLQATFVGIRPENIPRLGLTWRFLTHTKRASDIVQYAILSEPEADALRAAIMREENFAKRVGTPQITLEDNQRGNIVVAVSDSSLADYEVVPQETGTRFVPVRPDPRLSSGITVDVCGHPGQDMSTTVDLKVWLVGDAHRPRRHIQVGSGPDAALLPIDRPAWNPGHFDVQFVLRQGETVVFTRPDMIYADRPPFGPGTRQLVILMKLGAGEATVAAKAP